MQFILALVVFLVSILSFGLVAYGAYQLRRRDGTLGYHRWAITAALLKRVALLLVAVLIYLATVGRASMILLTVTSVIALSGTAMGIWDAFWGPAIRELARRRGNER